MSKRLFEILDQMNVADGENGTRMVALSNTFISGNKVKLGSHITMGADEEAILDIASGKVMPILLLINTQEYERLKK